MKRVFIFFALTMLLVITIGNISALQLPKLQSSIDNTFINYCSENFVPYSNALQDINLNQRSVTNIHLIQFANLTNIPTCNLVARGIFGYTQGALGVADQLLVCKKNALDLYVWTPI